MKFYLYLLVVLFYFNGTAFAYIDPGTGGFILQALIGAIAAVSIFFQRIKFFFIRLFKRKDDKKKQD